VTECAKSTRRGNTEEPTEETQKKHARQPQKNTEEHRRNTEETQAEHRRNTGQNTEETQQKRL
jgi:hypothetical protein